MADLTCSVEDYLRSVLDAFPSPIFVMDEDLCIRDANVAGRSFVDADNSTDLPQRLCGDVLQCINTVESPGGCGTSAACAVCVLRQAAGVACADGKVFRRTTNMLRMRSTGPESVWYVVTGAPLPRSDEPLALVTLEDVTELVELRRLVPMCSHCRKVRNEANAWQQVEEYLTTRGGMKFTHGFCPDCLRELYPEVAEEVIRDLAEDDARTEAEARGTRC